MLFTIVVRGLPCVKLSRSMRKKTVRSDELMMQKQLSIRFRIWLNLMEKNAKNANKKAKKM